MARRFRAIPAISPSNDDALRAAVDVIGYITAQTMDKIAPLAATATAAQTVAKVNEILARLQGSA